MHFSHLEERLRYIFSSYTLDCLKLYLYFRLEFLLEMMLYIIAFTKKVIDVIYYVPY